MQQALNFHFDLLADVRLAVVDHDHRAVGHIADALAFVLAFAHDFQAQNFTGKQNHFEALGDFMEVDIVDFLQLGDLGEVVVVGEKPGVEVARQADEFGVHVLFVGKITVMNADFNTGVALNAVEHFESAPAAGALDGIGGIGNLLNFFEHEPRHDNQALQKMGFNQISDATVNDDAGIEQQQIVCLALLAKTHVRNDEREILLVAAHGENDADIAEA